MASPITFAEELAKGGAYTAWLIATIEAGVIVFLFKKLDQAYKKDGEDTAEALNKINSTQMQHTLTMSTLLRMLEGIQTWIMQGGAKK